MKVISEDKVVKVFEFIKEFQKNEGRSPSFRQIAKGCSFPSLATAQKYVNVLQERKMLQKNTIGKIIIPNNLSKGKTIIAPLVGTIACGTPIFAEENIEESFSLPQGIFGHGKLFMLRAFGNSMIDAGISAGDLLVLRQQDYADEGEIVVALVGEDATLKRFYKKGHKIVLHPENKTMQDIIVDDCQIQGVLVSCIKIY